MFAKLFSQRHSALATLLAAVFTLTSCRIPTEVPMSPHATETATMASQTAPTPAIAVIPRPVSVALTGETFTLTAETQILVEPDRPELLAVGQYLAERLRPATGYPLPVQTATGAPPPNSIYLTTSAATPRWGKRDTS
jgi:hypothetical protein